MQRNAANGKEHTRNGRLMTSSFRVNQQVDAHPRRRLQGQSGQEHPQAPQSPGEQRQVTPSPGQERLEMDRWALGKLTTNQLRPRATQPGQGDCPVFAPSEKLLQSPLVPRAVSPICRAGAWRGLEHECLDTASKGMMSANKRYCQRVRTLRSRVTVFPSDDEAITSLVSTRASIFSRT
jgi:hypothetical protein